MSKNETPLEKLGRLSASRTVRTDRLREAVQTLCTTLDRITGPTDAGELPGCGLRRVTRTSNTGSAEFWEFSWHAGLDEYGEPHWRSVALDWQREQGYLHGDFSCPMRGPMRRDLLEFAKRADELIANMLENAEREDLRLAVAEKQIETASERI